MVVWKPFIKKAFYEEKHEQWEVMAMERGNQYKIILTLEMIGNLHTLLHSQATYIHHVHREDGYGDAPRGTN